MPNAADLLRAIAILASRRTDLGNKWAVRGSALDRGREILEHAQLYLYEQYDLVA